MIDYFLGAPKHERSGLRSRRRRPNRPHRAFRGVQAGCLSVHRDSPHLVQASRPPVVPAVPRSLELSTEEELERVQKFSRVRGSAKDLTISIK
jgi:hypothetical protein